VPEKSELSGTPTYSALEDALYSGSDGKGQILFTDVDTDVTGYTFDLKVKRPQGLSFQQLLFVGDNAVANYIYLYPLASGALNLALQENGTTTTNYQSSYTHPINTWFYPRLKITASGTAELYYSSDGVSYTLDATINGVPVPLVSRTNAEKILAGGSTNGYLQVCTVKNSADTAKYNLGYNGEYFYNTENATTDIEITYNAGATQSGDVEVDYTFNAGADSHTKKIPVTGTKA
jgi:hypothetical protein